MPKLETCSNAIGRGALSVRRSGTVRFGGVLTSENAGMSSESTVRICTTECPRFPSQCNSAKG